MNTTMSAVIMDRLTRATVSGAVFLCCLTVAGWCADTPGAGVFLIAPMAGTISSDIQYTVPGSADRRSLNDSGGLYALNMMYARPSCVLGSMGHYSKLDHSTESGYLFYANWFFRNSNTAQPMLGFYADYIHVLTKAPAADIVPLLSMQVDTSIWALHPVVGVRFDLGSVRLTPFAGYFNEQVDTAITSEGMRVAGTVRNGFSAAPSVVIDYMSLGARIELTLRHFIKLDSKFYTRFAAGEQARFTARNRLDFFLTPRAGLSLKFDYFDDKYEKNTFAFVGPVFMFQ